MSSGPPKSGTSPLLASMVMGALGGLGALIYFGSGGELGPVTVVGTLIAAGVTFAMMAHLVRMEAPARQVPEVSAALAGVLRERKLTPVPHRLAPGPHWAGTLEGVPVEVKFEASSASVSVAVTLAEVFPRGLMVHTTEEQSFFEILFERSDPLFHEETLDQALRVTSRDLGQRALILGKPAVMDALTDLVERDVDLHIEAGTLRLQDRPTDPDQLSADLDQAVALAQALSDGASVWERLGTTHGLRFEQRPGVCRLHGSVDGCPLELQCLRGDDGWQTTAQVELAGLPTKLSVHKATGQSGDLILDRFLRIDPPELGAVMLRHPTIDAHREAIVEAAAQWTRFELVDGRLTLGCSGASQVHLEPLFEAAIEVARALQAVLPEAGDSAEVEGQCSDGAAAVARPVLTRSSDTAR